LQEEVMHWGPNFFSQNGTQPLVYVVVLLMSQHFGHAVQYMGSQAELKDHGAHLAIACNHLKVAPCLVEHECISLPCFASSIRLNSARPVTFAFMHTGADYCWLVALHVVRR
jgi:hypothetical protein